MDLKKLIKEIERLNEVKDEPVAIATRNKLEGITETIEALYNDCDIRFDTATKSQDFQKLRKLLSLSNTTDSKKS